MSFQYQVNSLKYEASSKKFELTILFDIFRWVDFVKWVVDANLFFHSQNYSSIRIVDKYYNFIYNEKLQYTEEIQNIQNKTQNTRTKPRISGTKQRILDLCVVLCVQFFTVYILF